MKLKMQSPYAFFEYSESVCLYLNLQNISWLHITPKLNLKYEFVTFNLVPKAVFITSNKQTNKKTPSIPFFVSSDLHRICSSALFSLFIYLVSVSHV